MININFVKVLNTIVADYMQSLAPYSGDKSLRLSQLSEDEQRGEGDKYDRLHRRII